MHARVCSLSDRFGSVDARGHEHNRPRHSVRKFANTPGELSPEEGYVLSRSEAHKELFSESERRRHSIANITLARVLSSRLGGRDALVFAVSGSTSYQSASVHDDIDLFCVTPRGKMWIFLAEGLGAYQGAPPSEEIESLNQRQLCHG